MNLILTGGEVTWFEGPILFVVLLIVIGFILVAAEVFITPGFGVAGIAGLVLLLAGSVMSWVLLGSLWGALTIAVVIVATVTLVVAFTRSRAIRKRLVLETNLGRGGGTESEDLSRFVGTVGVAKTDLRPAGIVLVDGTRLDVVSDGDFIERDARIKIVALDGPRVVVARLKETKEK